MIVDTLHAVDIEIVSPTFMIIRKPLPKDLAFDKAEQAVEQEGLAEEY